MWKNFGEQQEPGCVEQKHKLLRNMGRTPSLYNVRGYNIVKAAVVAVRHFKQYLPGRKEKSTWWQQRDQFTLVEKNPFTIPFRGDELT